MDAVTNAAGSPPLVVRGFESSSGPSPLSSPDQSSKSFAERRRSVSLLSSLLIRSRSSSLASDQSNFDEESSRRSYTGIFDMYRTSGDSDMSAEEGALDESQAGGPNEEPCNISSPIDIPELT